MSKLRKSKSIFFFLVNILKYYQVWFSVSPRIKLTCVAVNYTECIRMPVTKKLSSDNVRIESHHLKIPGVMPLVESRAAAFMVVHSWRRVADYVYLTVTEQNREWASNIDISKTCIVNSAFRHQFCFNIHSCKLDVSSDTIDVFYLT